MSQGVLERILTRAKELGMSPRAASLASGLSATAIRDLVRKPDTSPSLETVRKFSVGLQTTPEWLAYGTDDERSREPQVSARPAANPALIRAAYGGTVEAGSYRQVDEFDDDPDRPPTYVPRDPQYPQARLTYFDVVGDSMNDLRPIPLLPGARVLCVAIEAIRIELRDKMVVVVEQSINGGHLRERSVKQIAEYDDRYEFCPRSRNPKHKPIVVPKDFKADGGRTVAVIAVVRDVINRVPLE